MSKESKVKNAKQALQDYLLLASKEAQTLHDLGDMAMLDVKGNIASAMSSVNAQKALELRHRVTSAHTSNPLEQSLQHSDQAVATAGRFGTTPPSDPTIIPFKKKEAVPPAAAKALREKQDKFAGVPQPNADKKKLKAAEELGTLKQDKEMTMHEAFINLTPQQISEKYKKAVFSVAKQLGVSHPEGANEVQVAAIIKKHFVDLDNK